MAPFGAIFLFMTLSSGRGHPVKLIFQFQALLLEFMQGFVIQGFDFLFIAQDALIDFIVLGQ